LNGGLSSMYAVIMAGGIGTRFWPRSRQKHPKQLLKILGNRTLIQQTVDRLDPLIKQEHIFIVSTQLQMDEIQQQLPFLKPENLIVEPKGKNTAPCIGLAALFVKHLNPDAIMAVLPADHNIKNEDQFKKVLAVAEQVAQQEECLVTIGINPTYPSTGYGYIQLDREIKNIADMSVYRVKTFAEKPDIRTAERFINSGDFLWNSGMFVWKAKTILREIEEALPELYDGLLEIDKTIGTKYQDEVINKVYCQIKSISIDYGVMEHTRHVNVLKGDFGWSDVGSWEEVYQISDKDEHMNVFKGSHFAKETHDCLIDSPDKFVATLGVQDLVIVNTKDALLICHRDKAQNVKELVESMKRKEFSSFL